MLSASLKDVITIQVPTEAQDGIGNVTTTWATLGTRRAQVLYNAGTKFEETDIDAELHSSSVTFIFRHIEGLTHKCQIVLDAQDYTITSIEKLRRREGFKVITRRRENG
jgi:head-tail adaptor